MTLGPTFTMLLDETRSEAKRWAAQGPNPLLLGLVLARKEDVEFCSVFGDEGQGLIESQLSSGGSAADEPGVVALLEGASAEGGVHALIRSLAVVLAPTIPSTVSVLATAAASTPAPAAEVAPTPPTPTPPEAPPQEDALDIDGRVKHLLRLVPADASITGRDTVVDDVLAVVARQHPGVATVVGRPGSGRTSIATALATRLASADYKGPLAGARVVLADAGPIIAEGRGRALSVVLEALEGHDDLVLFLDDVDVLAGMTGPGADPEVLGLLRMCDTEGKVRLVVTLAPQAIARLSVYDPELGARLAQTVLSPLPAELLRDCATRFAAGLTEAHGVVVPEDVVLLSTVSPGGSDDWAQPGLAARRLDAACVRARLRGASTVSPDDLRLSADSLVESLSSVDLAARLSRRVIGQESAVTTISKRLALTKAGLDLRPERPDGAFLFVGPTGVGKTELAKAVCVELFGDDDRLIRLDMSEYAEDWAISRLIGPQPGYVGSTEPESWLTTRVRHQPETVVLLDEIEKAHPAVWNTFLQVLDAGRLSDSRGEVADFSRAVVIMTSNIGSGVFSTQAIGFNRDAASQVASDRVLEALKATMAPELLNRLDAVAVFRPLSPESLLDIAAKEVDDLVERLADRGYHLVIGDGVVAELAKTGYDPEYGARHLQRNIERLLLQPLADMKERSLTAHVDGTAISWTPS